MWGERRGRWLSSHWQMAPCHHSTWSFPAPGTGEEINYSATREDDTTFIFSHFGLFLSDAASNSHK